MNDERKKGSGTDLAFMTILLILFLMGVSVVLEVILIGLLVVY